MSVPRPPVAEESEYWFIDKSRGIRVSFLPRADEAMVTFAAGAPDAALAATITLGPDRKRTFAAVSLPHGQGAAQMATATPGVANAIPVMVDRDGLSRYFLPDELTVQFRPDQADEEIIRELGGEILVRQRTDGYYTVSVPEGQGLFATIRRFTDRPGVAFAEPSEVAFDIGLSQVPDDPRFGEQWGLYNTGQTVEGVTGTPGQDINVTPAWDLHRGDPDVIVAVIDTGADLDHPDLAANLLPRGDEDWDFSDNPNDPSPDDDGDPQERGHGTHVAGIAAAVDNVVGVIGVAPGCRFMPLRLDFAVVRLQNIVDALRYVIYQAEANPQRRYVINGSWAVSDHVAIHAAVTDASKANVVLVFAAGNHGKDTAQYPVYPGAYPEVISVAALDANGYKRANSAYGVSVDVSAPGSAILSTFLDGTHRYLSGTSMAAPHVSGVAALVRSVAPGLNNWVVRDVLQATCQDVYERNPHYHNQLGAGRPDAYAAMRLAQLYQGVLSTLPATTS